VAAATKKVLYWIAGQTPSANEAKDIQYLNDGNVPKYQVHIRSKLTVGNQTYGSGATTSPAADPTLGTLETADYCASYSGAAIPAAYSGVATLSVGAADEVFGPGAQLVIGPAALSFVHTAKSQMSAFLVDDDGNVTDVTADAGMAWTSATGATATIGAGTGVLTGAGAGTTVVTATLTKSAKTIVATELVTCS